MVVYAIVLYRHGDCIGRPEKFQVPHKSLVLITEELRKLEG